MVRFTKQEIANLKRILNEYKAWKEQYPEESERFTMIAAHALAGSSYSGSTYWYREDLLFDIVYEIIKKYGDNKLWTDEELKAEVKKQEILVRGGDIN